MGAGWGGVINKQKTQNIASRPKIENPDFLDLGPKSGKWAEKSGEKKRRQKKINAFFGRGSKKKVVDFFNKNNFLAPKIFFQKIFSENVSEENLQK